MKKCLLVLMISFLALGFISAQDDSAWYVGKQIKEIRFEGLQTIGQKDIDPVVRDYKARIFSEELWAELLTRVYDLGFFDEIVPEAKPGDSLRQSVIIVFKVTERPAVSLIRIEGNKGLRTSEIQDILTLKIDTIYKENLVRLDEIEIRKLYLDKGYPEITVSSRVEGDNGKITVIFAIDEGTRITLDKIEFSGISALSAFALKNEMELKERGLFQQGAFSEIKLETDRQSIELLYKTKGYINAQVADVGRQFVTEEKTGIRRLSLLLTITEGKRYTFDSVTFSGNNVFSTETLSSFFTMKKGTIFNFKRFMENKAALDDLYYENGYIFNKIDPVESRDEDRNSVSFVIQIAEQERAHIENIIIRGNTKTKDNVIYREIPLESGDIFSKTKIIESLRNLSNLQYFKNPITPQLLPGSENLLMDLVMNVEEQSTADINFGFSLANIGAKTSNFPIVGMIKWNDKNFMGNGQNFSIGANVAYDSQDLTFGFKENWLLGKRWFGGVDLTFKHESLTAMQDSVGPTFSFTNPARVPDPYSSLEEYALAGYKVPEAYLMDYETLSMSLGFSSGYTFLTPAGNLTLAGGYLAALNRKTYDDNLFKPFDKTIADNLNRWLISNAFYGKVSLNNLDLSYDPSLGYYASQRFTINGFAPNELNRYFRLDSRLDGYITLIDHKFEDLPLLETWPLKIVLGVHTGASFLLPWFAEDSVIASATNMLRIDGTFIGRGWSDLSTFSGTTLWENWLELRMPIVPNVIALDGFLDAAVLGTDAGFLNIAGVVNKTSVIDPGTGLSSLGLSNFALSLGGGIRFLIPQFPFRIYMAKRFYVNEGGAFAWANPGKVDFVLSVSQPLN